MSESSMSPEAPPLPPPLATATPPPGAKNPWVAVVLSLFLPGVGQVYNGQPAKALVFFLSFAGAIYCTATESPFFGLVIPFVYLFNLVDAYRSAVLGVGRSELIEDAAESPVWGGALILLGGLLLLNNFGWLNLHALARYWPVLLIAVGLTFLRGALQRRKGRQGTE